MFRGGDGSSLGLKMPLTSILRRSLFPFSRFSCISTPLKCYPSGASFSTKRLLVSTHFQRLFASLDVSSCDHSILKEEDPQYNLSHMTPQEIMVSYMRCSNCTGILAPPSPSHFMDILVPIEAIRTSNFDLDMTLVKERYLNFQRYLHPDLIAFHLRNKREAVEEQKNILEEWSAWVNRAWEVIKDPLRRAEYLVGVKESELDKMQTDSTTLMTTMQVREELESGKDVTDLKSENGKRLGETEEALRKAFQNRLDRTEIVKLIVKLKYWYSLRDAIKERE